ncbi:MAG: TonB-dependent receptor domain-containing protein [Flavobacteriales bacterium]
MRVLYAILLFFILGGIKSQYKVFGTLYSETDESLVNTLIELKNEKGVTINQVESDIQGRFVLENVTKGDFVFLISQVGFIEYHKKITVNNSNLDLGKIVLKSSNSIDEIKLTGVHKFIKNEIDRKVVDIGGNSDLIGASLNDIMALVPGVQVNNNETLLLRGNPVKVFVDNRLTEQTYEELLFSIDPIDIDQIEVITNPPAKYAAEGISGIVNIILKKNREKGFNTSVAMLFDYDEYPRHSINGRGNYNFGKLNIKASTNYQNIKDYKRLTQDREDVYYDTYRLLDYYFTTNRIGMDYYFNANNSLSSEFRYSYYDVEVDADIDSLSRKTDLNTRYTQFDKTRFREYQSKLFYQRKFTKKGHRLDIEGMYLYNDDEEKINYFYSTPYKSTRFNEEHTTRLNVDYINPLGTNSKLELGGEALWYDLKEDFEIREEDKDLNLRRNILGLYGIYQRKFNKINIQLGLRTEFTNLRSITVDDDFENRYIEFFPSTYVNYELNDENEFQLNYSRRIDRPSAYLFRPIRGEFNNYKSLGNNNLKPQLTDNIELSYKYQKEKWHLGMALYYRFIKDEIGSNRYLDTNNSNTIVYQRLNMGDKNEYGTEWIFSYKPFKWWSINSTWNLYRYKRQGFINNEFTEIEDNRLDGQLYSRFTITKSFKLSIDGVYNSAYDDFSGTFKNISRVNLSLDKSLMDNQLSFSIAFRDLFNTSILEYDQYRPLKSYDINYEQNQRIIFRFRYNFSSGKQKKRIKRKTRSKNITEGVGQ